MRSAIWKRITATALFTVLAIPAQVKAQEEQEHKRERVPHYRVTDLGTLGGTYSYAFGMNNAGEVAGGAATANQVGGLAQTAFLWSRGQMQNLGTLGGQNSSGSGVNARGEVAMMINWFGFAAMCQTIPESKVKDCVALGAIPHADGASSASLNVYWVLGIGAGSPHKDLAYRFLRHCASAPDMDEFFTP